MTTGEKLALFRKKHGMTQEELSEALDVSRQSVSRWELDAAFPETEKLIKLSGLFGCSIDFLLHEEIQEGEKEKTEASIKEYYTFIRECGHFFLATSVDGKPRLRPLGMIYLDDETLFIVTDKRKNLYSELEKNPYFELVSYHPNTHKWLRANGQAVAENRGTIKEAMMEIYPNLKQAYLYNDKTNPAIYKLLIDAIEIK